MLLKNFLVLPSTEVGNREFSNNSMSSYKYSLETLLDQEDIMQQIKMNSAIADFLLLPTTLYRLVAYCTQLPLPNASEAECFRYPFLSCELLCTESPSFLVRFFDNDCTHVLDALWNFLAPEKKKKRRFRSCCKSASSSKMSRLNANRRHSLGDADSLKPYNWTRAGKKCATAVNDSILCGYFSRIVAAMYQQHAALLTVYLKKREWILSQLLICCHQRAIAELVSGFLLQDTVSLTLYHPSRVMLALLVLIREDSLFQKKSEVPMDFCFRRQENIMFILEQILFLENDGESFSFHRKSVHFEEYILSLTCPTACIIFLQCLTTFSVITIKFIVRILSLLSSVALHFQNKALNKKTLCLSTNSHSLKRLGFLKSSFSKPILSHSVTSFLDSDYKGKSSKTCIAFVDTSGGSDACKRVFDKATDRVKNSLKEDFFFSEATKNILSYETYRDFEIWKYRPDILFLKPCLLMYYNENTTNHSTEELEVLAHSFFLEKWIAPYFQIIFEKIDNNLSERENVIKNVHQSRLGCKSSNSISCGNNSDEMEGSIIMQKKTNQIVSSKVMFFDTTESLQTPDGEKAVETSKANVGNRLSCESHISTTGFKENVFKERKFSHDDEKVLLECSENTENLFVKPSRDSHTSITDILKNGITQHEEENFILTTVKTLDPGQKDDNRNFFFNTNKTSNFVVRLPCGTYPRIGIECISILKLATILLRGAKESRLLIATPEFLNTLVRWFVMNHCNTGLHIAIAEIFQSIILVENPLQRIEILSTSDSCYTVQAKDNFQEEKKCSEYLLSLLLTKTDLLSQMTDIIKKYKQMRMEKSILHRRQKRTDSIKGSFIHTLHLASLIYIKTPDYPKELQDFLQMVPWWSSVIDEVLTYSNTLRVPLGGEAPKVENEWSKRQEYVLPLGLGCWIPSYKTLSNTQECVLEKNRLNFDAKAKEEPILLSDALKAEQEHEQQVKDTNANANSSNEESFIFEKITSHEECGINMIKHLNSDIISRKSKDDGHLLKIIVPSNVCNSDKIQMDASFLHSPALKSFDTVKMDDIVHNKDVNFISSATCTDTVDDLSFTIESISFSKPLDRWLGDLRLSFQQKDHTDDSYLIDLISRNVSVSQTRVKENQKDT